MTVSPEIIGAKITDLGKVESPTGVPRLRRITAGVTRLFRCGSRVSIICLRTTPIARGGAWKRLPFSKL